MNLHSVDQVLSRAVSLLSSFPQPAWPPAPFLSGLIAGLVFGILLTVVVLRHAGVASALRFVGRGLVVLAPPVLACLLWGAWIGILAAKQSLH